LTKTPIERATKILHLWTDNEEEWKQYHKLRDKIKEAIPKLKHSSERTIMRYLQLLVKVNKLEKKIKSDHSTWYKPKPDVVSKERFKEGIDQAPIVITTRALKTKQELGFFAKKLIGWGRKTEEERAEFESLSYYEARSRSERLKEWKKRLVPDFTDFLKKRYPELKQEKLETKTDFMITYFLQYLETNMTLGLFSSLNLPEKGITKYKGGSGYREKDFYAQLWDELFEILVKLLVETYKRNGSLQKFLENSRGSSLYLVVEANTDFFSNVDHFIGILDAEMGGEAGRRRYLEKWFEETRKLANMRKPS
jgi:hypothetical protein